jgi:MFS family permease
MDRRNSFIYLAIQLLVFVSSPVFRVDVVQAGLCNKLGASATVANLPAAAILLGAVAPFFLSWLIPHSADQKAVVWSNALMAASAGVVCLALFLPFRPSILIAVVVGQSLLVGFTNGTSFVYLWQCLGRGVTLAERAKILGLTNTLGPICAVAGSLGAQFLVSGGIRSLCFPYDFAVLYLFGFPVMGIAAFLATRFKLSPMKDEQPPPLLQYLIEGTKSFIRARPLGLAWLGYLLWYVALYFMPTLTLFSTVTMNRKPATLVGIMMALRYGGKSLSSYRLGRLNLRWGMRAPVIATIVLVLVGVLWAWTVHGYLYLVGFGLLGAGELGGVYFPNYVLATSKVSDGARNLSVLALTSIPVGLSPVIYGQLTDRSGYGAGFIFAGVVGLGALWCVLKLPEISATGREVIKTIEE